MKPIPIPPEAIDRIYQRLNAFILSPTTADVIRIAKLVTAEELRVEGFDWITTDHVFASFVHDALSIQVFRELPRTCSIRIGEKDA